MGRGAIDPNGTQTIATALGITRRAVQKRLKKAREAEQVQPALPTLEAVSAPLAILPSLCEPMKEPPKPCRIEWCEASARAGMIEKMISRRLKEALIRGDIPTARMMASALKDIISTIRMIEPEAMRWFKDGQYWLEDVELETIFSEGAR